MQTLQVPVHLKPRLPAPQTHHTYHVITVSHRFIHLYRANAHRIVLVRTFDSPAVEPFVQEAAASIRRLLRDYLGPVILVGSQSMRRLYRSTSLATEGISAEVAASLGLHETRSLHRLTWPLARREFLRRHRNSIEKRKLVMNPTQPAIRLTDADHRKLSGLLGRHRTDREDLENLEEELERATIVAREDMPADVVTLYSTVTYRDLGAKRSTTIQITMPDDADLERGRVSVLAPVGSALLGVEVGQTIDWPLPDGRTTRLAVKKVGRAATN